MKLYYLFLLVMFFLLGGCTPQSSRGKSITPVSVRDTVSRSNSTWKKSKTTYKKHKTYKSLHKSRRHRR